MAGVPATYGWRIENDYQPAITISATYGAAGSVVAPRLAERLGLRFVDRLLSIDGDSDPSGPAHSEEGLVRGEAEATPAGRFLSYFARVATVGTLVAPDPLIDTDEAIKARSESALEGIARGEAGLVLGRAGAVVLARRPRAFHVRLDGPVARRLEMACKIEGLDEAYVRRRQEESDRARTLFVKRLYRADPASPALYHMVLDTTALGVDASVDVIAAAASAFFSRFPSGPAGLDA